MIIVIVSIVLGTTPLPTIQQPPNTHKPPSSLTINIAKVPPSITKVDSKIIPIATTTNIPSQSGSCSDWMNEAGITDIVNAMRILDWESHCNPNAVNPSSGACGLAQELPCGKSGCTLGDGACQMRWFNQYVLSRYGSFAAAVSFHLSHGWY